MRALVISGGGSKGAFAGGVAEYLIDKMNNDYDIYIGTSTGSLLVTHLALKKTQILKNLFTQVTQEKIFDNSPFKIKKKGEIESISINHLNVIKNFIRGKKTFGESNNLRKTIEEAISSFKPPIFWKDKEIVKQQINNWSLSRTENLIYKTNELELLIKKNSYNSINILSDFIINQPNRINN